MGTEEEVAASILFLLSPAASFITGVTLRVDAGESIYSPLLPPTQPNISGQLSPWKDVNDIEDDMESSSHVKSKL